MLNSQEVFLVHAIWAYTDGGDLNPLILKLCFKYNWVVNFTTGSLYPWYPSNDFVGPRADVDILD
jgi:hypothetical protein